MYLKRIQYPQNIKAEAWPWIKLINLSVKNQVKFYFLLCLVYVPVSYETKTLVLRRGTTEGNSFSADATVRCQEEK